MATKLGHHSMTWGGWFKKNEQPFDLDRVLREVRDAGYDGVEIGGDEKRHGKAADLKRKVADHGLELAPWGASVTANPHPPATESFQRSSDYAAELGINILAVCGGFTGKKRRNTFEWEYELFGQNLRDHMAYAAKNGQEIAYHPHVGCLVETTEEFDRLLKYAPDLKLLVDTGHLIAVGSDPIALMKKHADKVVHVHLKDWDKENEVFMEIGHGNAGLDFTTIYRAFDEIGYNGWVVVERDASPIPPDESARLSRDHLEQVVHIPRPTATA